ncbi:MAG: carboxylating nicotinate-nucleotide diphosphorylase [Verrucomicrobia bacterium]|nr:carboxylating nicotinate-nucleotide diphosphorylase [Verrucomicrobiota bacterium]
MDLVDLALAEDLGPQGAAGDITSQTFIPGSSISSAKIVARSACVASGLAVAQEVFRRVDPSLTISVACAEGDSLSPGALLLEVTGPTRSILSGERTALNFLGHLCGIATISRRYADALADAFAHVGIASAVKLLDTRKTTPGWRALEKQAVKAGGCLNHRMGLYDAALVKDNHLAALADLSLLPPVIATLHAEHPGLPIEIEADTLEQVEKLLVMPGIDVILLDNMSPELMIRAVALRAAIAPGVLLEASGGVTLESLGEIARTGVDRISVGALTHSAMNADLSLELEHVS